MNCALRVLFPLLFLFICKNSFSNAQDVNSNTFRLPKSIKPTTYEVTIHPHVENKTYQATVAIFADCITPTNVIILNGFGFTMENILVKKIVSNSEELLVNATSNETSKWEEDKTQQQIKIPLSVTLESGNKIVIKFKFTKAFGEREDGLFYREYTDNAGTLWKYVTTIFEPFGARMTFPCFDEPAMRAIFKFKIIRDKQYKSLFNTLKIQTSQVNEDLECDEYEDTPVMSTYILMFAVFPSNYEYRERTYGNLIVRAHAPRDDLDHVSLNLDVTLDSIRFMENQTGIAFPAKKLDIFGIHNFPGGMENWGLIAYALQALSFKPQTDLLRVQITTLVTHEIVHHWFGNYATMKWWNDVWVKEGTTTYLESEFIENENKRFSCLDEFRSAINDDVQFSSYALSLPDNFIDAFSLYGGFVYSKGKAIMIMIEKVLGRAKIIEGLNNFLNRYQYSSADSYDFWNSMTDVNTNNPNINLTILMEPWTKETNFPLIHVTLNSDGRSFTARQERFLLNKREIDQWTPKWPSKFQHLWNVPLTFKLSPTDATDQIVWLTTREQTFQLNESVSWIKLNYNHYGYFVTNYDSAIWTHILENMRNTNFSALDNAGILLDIKLLLKSGQFDIATALDTLSILQTNPEPLTWKIGKEIIEEIYYHLRNHSQELGMFKRHMCEIVGQAMTQTGYIWNQNNLAYHTREMHLAILDIAMLVDENVTSAYLLAEFEKILQNENYVANKDVAKFILPFGVSKSGNNSLEILWRRYKEEALTHSKDCGYIARLLTKAYNDLPKTVEIMTGVAKNGHFQKSLWNYFIYISSDLQAAQEAKSNILKLIAALVKTFDTEEDLQKIKRFFDENPLGRDYMSEYKANVLEIVLTNMKWKSVHLDNVKSYYERKFS